MPENVFEVDGVGVPAVALDDMEFKEQRLIKSTFGLTPRAVADGLEVLDPDAWLAVIFISVRRVRPDVTVEDLEGLKLGDLLKDLEADESDPTPDSPSSSESEGVEPSEAAPEATPEDSGNPDSPSGSA